VFIACWSVKGGSGTTVVAASLAVLAARGAPGGRRGRGSMATGYGALLVDLAGDAPAAIGAPEPEGPGVADWLRAGERVPPDGWGRLEVAAGPGLAIVPRGHGALVGQERAEVLAGVLGADGRVVVVDCGVVPAEPARRWPAPFVVDADDGPLPASTGSSSAPSMSTWRSSPRSPSDGRHPSAPWSEELDAGGGSWPSTDVPVVLAAAATVSLLVIRPCYLALRRASVAPITPSGVVVVHEPGRALGADDVEDVLGVPVVAEVPYDPAVARAVDSGLLAQRLPRGLERSLRDAA